MQHMKRILAAAAAFLMLGGRTAGTYPFSPGSIPRTDQLRQLIKSLSALPVPEEPFALLRFDTNEQQLYCDGIPVGQQYAGCTVQNGTLRISAASLGITPEQSPQDTLSPQEAAQLAGIEYTEQPDGISIRSPFESSRLILQCDGTPQHIGNAEALAETGNLHILQYRTPAEAYAAYQRFQADSRICAVQPDCIYHADMHCSAVNDSDRDNAVSLIGADSYCEWLCAEKDTLPEIQIAVLDTGLYAEHNWFTNRVAAGGITLMTNDSDEPTDAYGHGTHCAGIIAQSSPENVKILPVKVLSDRGYGFGTEIYCGMLYAIEQGAEIVSMSLGGNGEDLLLDEGIAALTAAGVICVAAAGNEHEDAKYHHPARNPDCITVSSVSTDTDDEGNLTYVRSPFSNYGACVDFCAPGASVRSAFPDKPDQLWTLSGTSMATPFVAAACADLLSYDPSLSIAQVYALLKEHALDLGTEGFDTDFGWGMIDLSGIRFETPLPDISGNFNPVIPEEPARDTEQAEPAADSCARILPDQPFLHDSGQYSVLLDTDAHFTLHVQSGEAISGTLTDVRHPSSTYEISDSQAAELEAGNYILTLNTPAQTDPARQAVVTLQTEQRSVYMAEIAPVDAFFTGEAVTPHANVMLNGVPLRENIDYTIEAGKSLTKPGRYRLTLKGKGAYYDSQIFTFRILPDEPPQTELLTEGTHSAVIREPGAQFIFRWIPEKTQYCFTREDNRPGSIRIYDAEGGLVASLSGILEQNAVVDVIPQAEYRIVIAPESPSLTGEFPFTLTSDFRLLETCTVQMPARITTDAENSIPQYAVFDGETQLTEGEDYTVFAVGGEQQPGLADIVFRGAGKYCGFLEQTYEICPASPPETEAVPLPCGSTLTYLRGNPGTMQLFRFTAPADGSYRFRLPAPETDGVSTFVYDSAGLIPDAEQTDFTMKQSDELLILCVTQTLTTQFESSDSYQLRAAALHPDQEWESGGIRFRLTEDGTALVIGAEHDSEGGIRIPDTVQIPGSGETAAVCGIDAALRAEIAETHTIYGKHDGSTETYCREMSLCFAAEDLTDAAAGDLTGDGEVTWADLLTLNRILSECPGMILNVAVMQAADLNADGILDMTDLRQCRHLLI